MEKNARKLELIRNLGILNFEDFYNINIQSDGIRMQGYYKSKIVKALMMKKFNASRDDAGYTYLKRNSITIILT